MPAAHRGVHGLRRRKSQFGKGLQRVRVGIGSGEHEVAAGSLEVGLETGVRVRVEGPARFSLTSGMEMRLLSPALSSNIGGEGDCM